MKVAYKINWKDTKDEIEEMTGNRVITYIKKGDKITHVIMDEPDDVDPKKKFNSTNPVNSKFDIVELSEDEIEIEFKSHGSIIDELKKSKRKKDSK